MRKAPDPPHTATRSTGLPRKAVCLIAGTLKAAFTFARNATSSMGSGSQPMAPDPISGWLLAKGYRS